MNIKEELFRLRHADAESDKEITERFPPEWDMDAVYRKSIAKYRRQAGLPAAAADTRHITVRQNRTRIIAAACLLLTVGITGTVGWRIAVSRQQPPVVSEHTTATSAATLSTEGTSPAETAFSADSAQQDGSAAAGTSAAHTQKTASTPSDAAESRVTQTTDGTAEPEPAENTAETVSTAKTGTTAARTTASHTKTTASVSKSTASTSKSTASTSKSTASTSKSTASTSKSTASITKTTESTVKSAATESSVMQDTTDTCITTVTGCPPPDWEDHEGGRQTESRFVLDDDDSQWILHCHFEQLPYGAPELFMVQRYGYTAEPDGDGWRITNSSTGTEACVHVLTEDVTLYYPRDEYNSWQTYAGWTELCCFIGSETAELLWFFDDYLCILTTDAKDAYEFIGLVNSISTY